MNNNKKTTTSWPFVLSFFLYLSVLGFICLIFVFVLLIHLGAGPGNTLCSESKKTPGTGTPLLLPSNTPPLPSSFLTKRLPSLINYSHSINPVRPGALHTGCMFFCDDAIRSRVKETGRRSLSLVPRTLFISFTRLPSGPLGSRTRRPELLQASQTSEVLTRLWEWDRAVSSFP